MLPSFFVKALLRQVYKKPWIEAKVHELFLKSQGTTAVHCNQKGFWRWSCFGGVFWSFPKIIYHFFNSSSLWCPAWQWINFALKIICELNVIKQSTFAILMHVFWIPFNVGFPASAMHKNVPLLGRSWFSLWSSTSKVRLEKGVPVNKKLLAARPLLNNILTIVDKILGSLQLMFH